MMTYDQSAQMKIASMNRRVSFEDVIAVSRGVRSVEHLVADGYSFQSLDGIHKAYKEWLGIEFWTLLREHRADIGVDTTTLDQRLLELINSRHDVVHRFTFDLNLGYEGFIEFLALVRTSIDVLVDHLESEWDMHIR